LQLFRESLQSRGFIEIHTPKLLAGASEGGAAVFRFDYMGRPGCLAQSPQFYKQMAICSDLGRVFEIGPVFRAENSYTHRHLCEFTGLDMEMALHESYHEVLDVLDALFVHMFTVRVAAADSSGGWQGARVVRQAVSWLWGRISVRECRRLVEPSRWQLPLLVL
jgi:aspartyl/asparaginyl-tRNA synthetase